MKSTDMDVLVRYYEVFTVPASPPLDIGHLDLPLPEPFALAQKALDENTPIDWIAVYGPLLAGVDS